MLIKKTSAWLPILFSVMMLVYILTVIFFVGVDRNQRDEGVGAHLFWLWALYEVVAVLFFAARWFAKEPKQTLKILCLQILFVVLAAAPVFILQL